MQTNEDMMEQIILERMSYHAETGDDYDEGDNDESYQKDEKAYTEVLETLSESDQAIIGKFLDHLATQLSGVNEFYYRKGLEDGVKLDKLITSWKEKK